MSALTLGRSGSGGPDRKKCTLNYLFTYDSNECGSLIREHIVKRACNVIRFEIEGITPRSDDGETYATT